MAQQGEQKTPSDFDARADNAARSLRGNLQRQGRQVSDSSPVLVDEDGKPPAPLPPQGSYARQALELQQREAQRQIGDQPVAGTAEQAMDGSPAPRLEPDSQPKQTPASDTMSPRAEQRIQELVGQLRQRERELQEAIETGKKATETASQFQKRLTDIEMQHAQMLQANLDNLDPETRLQVMQDARMAQRLDEFEARILGKIQPQLRQIESTAARTEMQALSDTYPAFDLQIHGHLIDMFRAKNPHCSIEQAFRAIADPDELVTRQTARAQAVPPIVPPGNGELAAARFAPGTGREKPQENPKDELVEESRRIADLRRSTDPSKQKEGLKLLDEHLARRLSR
jgi:hypothetical protein